MPPVRLRRWRGRRGRGEAVDKLKALGGSHLHADENEHAARRCEDAAGEDAAAEDVEGEKGVVETLLPLMESDSSNDCCDHSTDEKRVSGPGAGGFLDGHGQARQRQQGVGRADEVPMFGGVGLIRRAEEDCTGECNGDDGDIDEEDGAPPEELEQETADKRAGSCADDCCRRPDADGDVALVLLDEDLVDQRQCCRHHRSSPGAEHRTRRDKRPRGGGECGSERGETEDD